MKKFLKVIKKSPLFGGVTDDEILSMLGCLSAESRAYKKNEFIYRVGERVSSVGMVLSGSVHIIKEDFWGNRSILKEAGEGRLFGETYACAQNVPLGVSVLAPERAVILFLDVKRILTVCSSACVFHTRLIRNLLFVLAEENLALTGKIGHMTQRTTREKLLSFLSAESQKKGSNTFNIAFNRQQLADYLSVDRSAMSSELCRLRDEGVLEFSKNSFKLK
ncbi:MAG: Crp/Fnr family transcriptional regulator [Bacillota bacterium]|nr:Crp/Fnr family transcriptional regulator [Bacillota bacterium]